MIENTPYDALAIGQSAHYTKQVTEQDILLFAAVSGDRNPIHLDAGFAATTPFGERIAHGMLIGALVSAALAMTLPGPGSIYLGQSLKFRRPVKIDDVITVHLTVTDKRDDKRFVTLDCKVINQRGETVATGTADVMAAQDKIRLPVPDLPTIRIG